MEYQNRETSHHQRRATARDRIDLGEISMSIGPEQKKLITHVKRRTRSDVRDRSEFRERYKRKGQ